MTEPGSPPLDTLLQTESTSGIDANELLFSLLSQNYPDLDLMNYIPTAYGATANQMSQSLANATNVVQFQTDLNNLPNAVNQQFTFEPKGQNGHYNHHQYEQFTNAQNGQNGQNGHHYPVHPISPTSSHSPNSDTSFDSNTMVPTKSHETATHAGDDEEEYKTKRREQIKKASKLYRARKKQSEKKLETELEKLRAEKEQLLRERQSALTQVEALKQSVNSHRTMGMARAAEMETGRIELLAKLKAVYQSDSCTNEALLQVLTPLRETCRVISGAATCYAQHLISTSNSILLAQGFLTDCTYLVETEKSSYGIGMFYSNLLQHVPSISAEQRAALNEVVARYYTNLAVIHGERKELSLEMALFENTMAQELLGTTNAATTPMIQPVNAVSQTQRNLQKLTMLDCLRRNLHSEVNLFEGAVDSLLNLLTPRQQAQLLLKVDLKSTSVLMLQGIYKRTELTSSSTVVSCPDHQR